MTHPRRIPKSKLVEYKKLLQKKYRRVQRQFVIEGVHLVEEALASDWDCEALLVSENFLTKNVFPAIADRAAARHVMLYEASDRELETLTDTVTSQGIVGIVNEKSYDAGNLLNLPSRRSLIIALDDIADPGNLGAIVRTCDWFGTDALVLSEDTVELYNPKVIRATMGSMFHMPIVTAIDLEGFLASAKRCGFTILAAVPGGESVLDFGPIPDRAVVVFGNEAHGIHENVLRLASATIAIPRFGKAESLNVAVSAAAVLTALRLRRP